MPENILILTPYHDFGEMLRLGLAESQNFFPYLSHNSGEALHAASQYKFSLVILDTEIPGPDFHELWKDLQITQPDMQLVLIFPENEEDYPSLEGLAPLGCVDHLLYMPDLIDLIESAFPPVEETITNPAPVQQENVPEAEKSSSSAQAAQSKGDATAWLEDAEMASKHLEEKLSISSAKAAMIARSDTVLAYSDELEVSAAQEIANRFTKYWNADGKNSDLVRFIHLGPMNHAYLLYVTGLIDETVLAALYHPDTPLSQPHRQISKLAKILLREAPVVPKNGTGPLEITSEDGGDDVYSQRMRMVTGSLRPMGKDAQKEKPASIEETDFAEAEDEFDDDVFDPEQFNLEELLSHMPSPDPVAPEPFDKSAPPAPAFPTPAPDHHISQDAVENLRSNTSGLRESEPPPEPKHETPSQPKRERPIPPWESGTGALEQAKTLSQNRSQREAYPWKNKEEKHDDTPPAHSQQEEARDSYPWESVTADSTQAPESSAREDMSRDPYPWEIENTSSGQTPASPAQEDTGRAPYPWEMEAATSEQAPASPVQDDMDRDPYPWEIEAASSEQAPASPAQEDTGREPYPWEVEAASSEQAPASPAQDDIGREPYPWEPASANSEDFTPASAPEPKDTVQNLRRFTDSLNPDHAEDLPDEQQAVAPFEDQDAVQNLRRFTDSLNPDHAEDLPDQQPAVAPFEDHDAVQNLRRLTDSLNPDHAEDLPDEQPAVAPFEDQAAVQNLRRFTDSLNPDQAEDLPDEQPAVAPFKDQDAVENVRPPWESETGSLRSDAAFQEPAGQLPAAPEPENALNDLKYPWDSENLDEENTQPIPLAQEPDETQWGNHTERLTPPPDTIEETRRINTLPKRGSEPDAEEPGAVESLRTPWETDDTNPDQTPPNGHNEFEEEEFEPLPDFSDLESTSESPLGNGWQREKQDQESPTAEDDTKSKIGTSPLKRPATKSQQPEIEEDDEYSDCIYTYTTFVTPLLKRHALTRELAQILAKSMSTVCEKNHWKLLNMTARPSGMLWTARIPPNVTTGQMVKIIREETSDMLYEVHPRLKYEALSENFWAANYLVVSGEEPPDDNSIKEFLQRLHMSGHNSGSRH